MLAAGREEEMKVKGASEEIHKMVSVVVSCARTRGRRERCKEVQRYSDGRVGGAG